MPGDKCTCILIQKDADGTIVQRDPRCPVHFPAPPASDAKSPDADREYNAGLEEAARIVRNNCGYALCRKLLDEIRAAKRPEKGGA